MGALRSRARMNAARMTASNGAPSRAPATKPDMKPAVKNGAMARTHANGTLRKPVAPEPTVREERLQRILEMIESGKPCTIQALAEEFNLSYSRLQHLFKQQTGVCLGHLLTQQRLHQAADLLTHSNKRVKEIAHTVGYEHASSFIRAFERHFAQAPRLFRQNRQTQQKKLTA